MNFAGPSNRSLEALRGVESTGVVGQVLTPLGERFADATTSSQLGGRSCVLGDERGCCLACCIDKR